jgi:hypothetical protein
MKSFKEVLWEAIDAESAEKKLRSWSARVSGVSGPTLEYIKALEATLSYLAPTSSKTNAKFDKFIKDRMRRQKSAERLGQSTETERVGELPDPKEVEKSVEEPDSSELDMPSMKSLMSQDVVKQALSGGEPEKKNLEKVPSEEETGLERLKSLLSTVPGLRPSKSIKLSKVDTGSSISAIQKWSVGQKVNVGFTKGLTVIGGNSSSGWVLAKAGKKYLFVPSKTPKVGRGLYRIKNRGPGNA